MAGRPPITLNPQQLDTLAAQYREGVSLRTLAGLHHISYGAIRRLVLDAGEQLRPRGGQYRRRSDG